MQNKGTYTKKTVKFIFNFVLFNLVSSIGFSQQKVEITKDLLPNKAFDRMIIKDITYAIFGEYTPITGIKVDIAKPEATIAGFFNPKYKKSILVGYNVKGGATQGSLSFFGGSGEANNAFELAIPIHIISRCNSAKFIDNKTAIVRTKNLLIDKLDSKKRDTFAVIQKLYNKYIINYTALKDLTIIKDINGNLFLPSKELFADLMKKYFDTEYDTTKTIDGNVAQIDSKYSLPDGVNVPLIKDYEKYKKGYENINNEIYDLKIENVATQWTTKNYLWYSITPKISTQKTPLYHTKFEGRDSFYFKTEYPLEYGLAGYVNWLHEYTKKSISLYVRSGITVLYSNNLSSLSSFEYDTRSSLYTYPGIITEKSKKGTAYNYKQFKEGWLTEIPLELYFLPKKYPGLYFNTNFRFSKLFNSDDFVGQEKKASQIRAEGGIIFNFNNRDKDKNFLSLSLYFRHLDLTDKIRESKNNGNIETRSEFRDRNISYGLKVGIPITLTKKTE